MYASTRMVSLCNRPALLCICLELTVCDQSHEVVVNIGLREAIRQSVVKVYTAFRTVPSLEHYFPPLRPMTAMFKQLSDCLQKVADEKGLDLGSLYEMPHGQFSGTGNRGEFCPALDASICLPSVVEVCVRTVPSSGAI